MAVFIILIIYGIIAGVFISKKKMKMSQAVVPMMAFAILSSVALGQNYTMSVIPGIHDGIGVSNFLAALLLPLPENGWTKEMFQSNFELYLGISIVLILFYLVAVLIESKNDK